MFQKLLEKLSNKLCSSLIPYMIIGGQAVLVYGEPRLTKDIDITLGVGVESFSKVMEFVRKMGLNVLVEDCENFVKRTMVLPAIDKKSGIRIDLIFSFSPYERQAIERSRAVTIGKTKVKFASLEDVVIHKIIAGRPRDIEDIRTILLQNKDYEKNYILKWLKDFDSSLNGGYVNSFKQITKNLKHP